MGGIAGFFCRDGQTARRHLLESMTRLQSRRGPDGITLWLEGPVGLGKLHFHTTIESTREPFPLKHGATGSILLWEGRLDNREVISRDLICKSTQPMELTDGQLVLESYARWGASCFSRLAGDFVIVLWDAHRREFICARDPLGIRPFYYYLDPLLFVWASEIRPLFCHERVPKQLNEGMLAEHLADRITSTDETLFQNVYRLPPGHFLRVTDVSETRKRYWGIHPERKIRFHADEDYAAQFLALFQDAVQCRLHSHLPIGSELSGGLDSSSVTSVAQSLRLETKTNASGLDTFSLSFPGLSCDETVFIRAVTDKWELPTHLFPPSSAHFYREETEQTWDRPSYPNGMMSADLNRAAHEMGIRVLLTGVGGDEWLTGNRYNYTEWLTERRWRLLLSQIKVDHADSAHLPWLPLLKYSVWPMFPRPFRQKIKKGLQDLELFPWLHPEFVKNTCLHERLHTDTSRLKEPPESPWGINGQTQHTLEMDERLTSWYGLEKRHPFHDVRLVEFLMAIPGYQLRRPEGVKHVLRLALKDHLPESVRHRTDKVHFSHLFPEALEREGGAALFNSLALAKLGWVDQPKLQTLYDECLSLYKKQDNRYLESMWVLWACFALELWYKTVFISKQD
jgi:asparagine synthase (glutamine-hydrolysing)